MGLAGIRAIEQAAAAAAHGDSDSLPVASLLHHVAHSATGLRAPWARNPEFGIQIHGDDGRKGGGAPARSDLLRSLAKWIESVLFGRKKSLSRSAGSALCYVRARPWEDPSGSLGRASVAVPVPVAVAAVRRRQRRVNT